MNELLIEATLENIDTVIEFIGERLEDCSPKTQRQIEIAVDEIFSNIARYAYNPDVGNATVRVAVGDDITIEFEDSGADYDPLSKVDPDVSLPPEQRKAGGLGVFMVKNIMDSVEYRREGDKNILTVRKKGSNQDA